MLFFSAAFRIDEIEAEKILSVQELLCDWACNLPIACRTRASSTAATSSGLDSRDPAEMSNVAYVRCFQRNKGGLNSIVDLISLLRYTGLGAAIAIAMARTTTIVGQL